MKCLKNGRNLMYKNTTENGETKTSFANSDIKHQAHIRILMKISKNLFKNLLLKLKIKDLNAKNRNVKIFLSLRLLERNRNGILGI